MIDHGRKCTYGQQYAGFYDELWEDDDKYLWEINEIHNNIQLPDNQVSLLDAGSGTGTHYSYLADRYKVTGLDISPDMTAIARNKNNNGDFVVGDMNDRKNFNEAVFTHIMSMYDATFYNKNLTNIIKNYNFWLEKDGLLFIETIDPDNICSNIAPRENSVYYEKKGANIAHQAAALTQYSNFKTHSWWGVSSWDFTIKYHEQIIFADGQVIKNEHTMYLPPLNLVERTIKGQGFKLISKKRVPNDPSEIFYVFRKL